MTYAAVALAVALVAVLGGLALGRVTDRADARRDLTVDAGGPPPTGPSPIDDVVIIGDSITEQAEPLLLDQLQPDSVVRVRGRGGYRIEQMEPYAIEAAAAEPEQVIINLGSNDVLLNWPLDRSVDAYTRLLDYFSDARCVHVVTVNQGFRSDADSGLAFRALLLNNQIRELATAHGADVIDWSTLVALYEGSGSPDGPITSDSIHPTAVGEQIMADAYEEALRTCL
jgi:lysophospholipase L1-like esterase